MSCLNIPKRGDHRVIMWKRWNGERKWGCRDRQCFRRVRVCLPECDIVKGCASRSTIESFVGLKRGGRVIMWSCRGCVVQAPRSRMAVSSQICAYAVLLPHSSLNSELNAECTSSEAAKCSTVPASPAQIVVDQVVIIIEALRAQIDSHLMRGIDAMGWWHIVWGYTVGCILEDRPWKVFWQIFSSMAQIINAAPPSTWIFCFFFHTTTRQCFFVMPEE